MKKELKTVTIGTRDNPSLSLCEGHVSEETFLKAFENEGWEGGDLMDVRYEYWIPLKTKWKKSHPENKKAIPVTVSDW